MNKQNNIVKRRSQNLLNVIVVALIVGFTFGLAVGNKDVQNFFEDNKAPISTSSDSILLGSSQINLCFTPPSGCGKVIADLISRAAKSIYMQAYGITSDEITGALIAAHDRGVKVRVLLDKSNLRDKYSKMQVLKESEIEVSIDKVSGIAHNKVIIIDEQKVITGSFNFTKSADSRNTENVIIVNDSRIADRYLQNWLLRKSKNTESIE